VIHLIALEHDRLGDIVTNELKVRVREHMVNIALGPSEQVIDGYNLVPLSQQSVAQMRSDKPSSTTHYYPCHTLSALSEIPLGRLLPLSYRRSPNAVVRKSTRLHV